MKLQVKNGQTNVSVLVFLQDDTALDGSGATGLTYTDVTCYYCREGAGTVTELTLTSVGSTASHTDGGFVEKSAANMPGVYRLDLPDSLWNTSTNNAVYVQIKGAAIAPCTMEFQKVDVDPKYLGVEIADKILDRDMSVGTDSGSTTVRTVRQALRFLRNKWTVASGVLTVYEEDDTATSWTASLTTTASADAIIGSDPAG